MTKIKKTFVNVIKNVTVTVIPPTQEDAVLGSRKNTVRVRNIIQSQLALLLFTKFIISHSSQQVR